jgi:hypothetical protein
VDNGVSSASVPQEEEKQFNFFPLHNPLHKDTREKKVYKLME